MRLVLCTFDMVGFLLVYLIAWVRVRSLAPTRVLWSVQRTVYLIEMLLPFVMLVVCPISSISYSLKLMSAATSESGS